MSFTTFAFALFLAAFYLLYFLLPSKIRWVVLIPANLIFYCAAGVKELPFMLAAAVLSYIAGRFLQRVQDRYAAEREKHRGTEAAAARKQLKQAKERRSRFILIAVLIPVMGIWAFFKADRTGSFTAPFAISYYTFIAVSYCADVFRGRHRCETNFLKFFAFLTFFPQMVEGPISRYETVGKAITEPHGFSFDRFGEGVVRAMWGYIKKMVLADRLWKIIAYVYGLADPTGPQVLMIVLLLPLQQFADFSGCMDIALGFAHAMGIDLQENFRQPIFSRSIEEVWRRWHITLGAFCRDYIFYPVSLLKPLARASKKLSVKHPKAGRLLPVLVSLTAVWTFMGLWHGFAWKYLIWGWMNLFFIAGGNIFKEQYAHLRTVFRVRQDSPAYRDRKSVV